MAKPSTNFLDDDVAATNINVIRQQLADFITTELNDGNGLTSIVPDDDLIRQGIVDSAGVLQIVGFIEQHYGVQVADEEIAVENFRTVSSIADLVARKVGRLAASA